MSEREKIWENRNVEIIISDLRNEVSAQKDCITRYTFFAMGFVGVVWGLVFRLQWFGIPFYLCSTLLIFMLLAVARMANHKYATVNRNLGYELHLHRLKHYAPIGNPKMLEEMLNVGWEEAMCAWRFTQPTIYEKIYEVRENEFFDIFGTHELKEEQIKNGLYHWYNTPELMEVGGKYHSGNYLRNIHLFLHVVANYSVIIMWGLYFYQFYQLCNNWPDITIINLGEIISVGLIISLITFYCRTQVKRQCRRREILENELLSIQSCAVVWRIVVICHIVGLYWAMKRHRSYRFYTTYTSGLSVNYTDEKFNEPHSWIENWETLYKNKESLNIELNRLFPEWRFLNEGSRLRIPSEKVILFLEQAGFTKYKKTKNNLIMKHIETTLKIKVPLQNDDVKLSQLRQILTRAQLSEITFSKTL